MNRLFRLVRARLDELRDVRRLRARIVELEAALRASSGGQPRIEPRGAIPVGDYGRPVDVPPPSPEDRAAADAFLRRFYGAWEQGRPTSDISWFGHRTLKCAFDLIIYQELICELRPDFIIEAGTRYGGSALYLTSICELLGQGQVISIDIDPFAKRPPHPRARYLIGSSTATEVVAQVERWVEGRPALVILDSDHSQAHVRAELDAYQRFVHPGHYLIVEDSCVNGHPVFEAHGPGPMEAVDDFLATTAAFVRDRDCERFLMSFNPGGYLRRVKP